MPSTRWVGRPHLRAGARLLVAGATLTALGVAPLVGAASAAERYPLAKTSVPLRVEDQRLGPWKPLVMQDGAYVGFTKKDAAPVLKMSDRPGQAGYVAVGALLTPTPRVVVTAKVNLVRQHLRRGKVRALLAITGGDGSTYQAGVLRAASGELKWAVWRKTPRGLNAGLRVGATATRGTWHLLNLHTTWAGPQARATMVVNKKKMGATPVLDADASPAKRVIVGLGRTSKKTETGEFLVQSARVRSTRPVSIRGGTPVGPGATPGQPGLGPTGQLPGRELLRADFETGDLSQWGAIHRVAADRLTVVDNPVRQGRFSGRFEVRNGDNPIGYGDRSQVTVRTGDTEGMVRWYGWSSMLAADFPRVGNWQLIAQWHSIADGSPPLAVFVENDELVLRAHRTSSPGNVLSIEDIWRGPIRRGQWQDFTFRIKWSGSDDVGWVEMWVDGKPQTMDNGATRRYIRTLYPGIGNYFVMCYYRQSGVSPTGVVFHDDFRMSDGGAG